MTVQELLDDKQFWEMEFNELVAHSLDLVHGDDIDRLCRKPNCFSLFLYHMRCEMARRDGNAHAYDSPATPGRQELLARDGRRVEPADRAGRGPEGYAEAGPLSME